MDPVPCVCIAQTVGITNSNYVYNCSCVKKIKSFPIFDNKCPLTSHFVMLRHDRQVCCH